MHKLKDDRYVIEDVARGRWGALDREMHIKAVTKADAMICANYEVVIEQEPGSGGKELAEATIRNLAGYRVRADKVTGSKTVRAQPFVAQVQGGNVWLSLVTGCRRFAMSAKLGRTANTRTKSMPRPARSTGLQV